MAVDKSYGSGYKNTWMSKATVSKQKLAKAPKSVTPAKRKTATALLKKKRADLAIDRSPNKNTKAAPMIGELSKMLTGIGTDAKGKFSIDPMGLAMALPLGKVVKAAGALRGAGRLAEASMLEARIGAKLAGKSAGGDIAAAGGKSYLNSPMGKFSIVGAGVPTKTFEGATLRGMSRNVFPDAPKKGSLGNLEFLPGMTKTQAAVKMRGQTKRAAYRKSIEGTRVTALEKRLNFPKKGGR